MGTFFFSAVIALSAGALGVLVAYRQALAYLMNHPKKLLGCIERRHPDLLTKGLSFCPADSVSIELTAIQPDYCKIAARAPTSYRLEAVRAIIEEYVSGLLCRDVSTMSIEKISIPHYWGGTFVQTYRLRLLLKIPSPQSKSLVNIQPYVSSEPI